MKMVFSFPLRSCFFAAGITVVQMFSYVEVGLADDYPVYELKLKNHRFDKEELRVKAGIKFRLLVKNEDNSFEEFESRKMIIEKFVKPGGTLNLLVGPLKPGEYDYFGEFNMSTAKGKLIAE